MIIDGLNISLRPAEPSDTDNMYDWEMDSIDPSLREDPKIQEYMHKDVEESMKDTQMIMCDDKTIGMFTASMIDQGEIRYIGEIYLIPEYRGHGIGTYLLKSEMEKYDKIKLQVAYSNTQAIKLYESLGFRIIESKDKYNTHVMLYDKTNDNNDREEDETMTSLEDLMISETALSASERGKLDDSDFGIPELRKYPLNDENHVRMANKFFGKAPKEHKRALAKKILAAAHKFNIDTSNWEAVNKVASEVVQESVKIGDKQPVYFVFVSEHKPVMSNAIRKITDTNWTHAGISFDPSLHQINTFGIRKGENYDGKNKGVGFALESITDYCERKTEDLVSVVVGFVDLTTLNKMRATVEDFRVNVNKTVFDWGVLAKFIAHKDKGGATGKKYVQVCSSFVDYVMNAGNIKVTPEGDLVSPESLRQGVFSQDNAVKEVYNGYASDYHEEFVIDATNQFAVETTTKELDSLPDDEDNEEPVQEFVSPIEKIKDDINQQTNLFNSILKIDITNRGLMEESIKQIEKPNLKPVMFIGFMDPENVQRTEAKNLIKHIVYAADNDTIYTSFFNSFTRRNEISNVASSMEALLNDFQNKNVKELHMPAHMKDCMISISDGTRTIHSRGNVPMKFTFDDGFYMNAYYAYFAIYEAFEFKRTQLFKNVSKTILDAFDGDETHFNFEDIDVVQENYATAKINIRFRYDDEPYILVVPVVGMKTQPAELYHEGARDEKNETEDVVQESVNENGLIKVDNLDADILYFGSNKDFGENCLKLGKEELFLTPYKGIASIFITDRKLYGLPHGSFNLAYEEWNASNMDEPFDDIHVIVEGCPDLNERTFEASGYIYAIDVSKLKDHIYRKSWMDETKEYLLCGINPVDIKEKIKWTHLIHIKGIELKKFDNEFDIMLDVIEESVIFEEPIPQTQQARLIELAHRGKLTGLSIEQQKLVDDYGNIKDQVYAAGEYYKREVKARKKELKRLQEEYSVASSEYDREKIKEDIIKITNEVNELTREYSENMQMNVNTLNQMADKFDELERNKSVQPSGGLLSKFINMQ